MTTKSTLSDLTMSTPNQIVAGMISCTDRNRNSHHGVPVYNVNTGAGMIDHASVNKSNRHGYPADIARTSGAVKHKTVYI